MERTIAHISDLHLGRDRRTELVAESLVHALLEHRADVVLVTGDVTHRGRREELAAFERLFAPLGDRVLAVPGNHDRLRDGAGRALMSDARVAVEARPGLHVVRVDSTAPHNRALLTGHGELSAEDVSAVDSAVAGAPPGTLVALMLHHHLLPLPEDHLAERVASLLGWPHAAELPSGRSLLERILGRCDVVLHGPRHAPGEVILPGPRPLRVMNAGSTPDLGRARLITHASGRVTADRWIDVRAGSAPRARAPIPAAAAA